MGLVASFAAGKRDVDRSSRSLPASSTQPGVCPSLRATFDVR